jgi:hypothetical protein
MSEEKKKALGRGLEALLPRRPAVMLAEAVPHAPELSIVPPNGHAAASAEAPLLQPRQTVAPAGKQWSAEFLEETQIRR